MNIGDPPLSEVFETKKLGPRGGTYLEKIEEAHPGYVLELYRAAIRADGADSSWTEIASQMEALSASDERGAIRVRSGQIRRWFVKFKGKYKSNVTRPILTEEHREKRLEFATRLLRFLEEHIVWERNGRQGEPPPPFYCAFLDEKWFYTTSRRRKNKVLPLQQGEQPGADTIPPRRVASRRFTTKVMYMGVVACPDEAHDFDGKIYMRRVSQTKTAKQSTYYSSISDHYTENKQIHDTFRDLHNGDMTVKELLDEIMVKWNLAEYVPRDRLVLRFAKIKADGKNDWVTMDESKPVLGHYKGRMVSGGPTTDPVELEHIQLRLHRKKDDEYEEDCSCDSEFMKREMLNVGMAMRGAYSWVPFEIPLYLILDNAGGHGKKDAIREYTDALKEHYNVILLWQAPRSPDSNLLDLGIWCGLQSCVEKMHRKKTKSAANALARTIEAAWHSYDSFESFKNVYERWQKVLRLTINSNGDNALSDSARRKEFIVPIVMGPPASNEDEKEDGGDPGDDEDVEEPLG